MAAILLPLASYGQCITYSYDATGNRILRQMETRGAQTPPRKNVEKQNTGHISPSVSISPNPTNGPLNICFSQWKDSNECHVSLGNMAGQVLIDQSINSIMTTIDLSSYSVGYYLLQIELNGEKETYKIIRK